jgi:quercetin dioxygenase-like cupin family protein
VNRAALQTLGEDPARSRRLFIGASLVGLCLGSFPQSALAIARRAPSSIKETLMILKRAGSQPSQKGPAEFFTGVVRIDPIHTADAPARVSAGSVTFEPGARSAWHTHPLGQILVVTAGCGWTQCEGEQIVEIRAGDVVVCPPGHKHWHGATSTTAMTHIAIQEALDGSAVNWMEKVTDKQYLALAAKA